MPLLACPAVQATFPGNTLLDKPAVAPEFPKTDFFNGLLNDCRFDKQKRYSSLYRTFRESPLVGCGHAVRSFHKPNTQLDAYKKPDLFLLQFGFTIERVIA